MSGQDDWIVSLHYTDESDRQTKYITIDDLAGGLILGRGKDDSTINILSSSVVSKVHCRLNITRDGSIYLGDLGSAHGTTIQPPNYPLQCPILNTQYPIRILEGDTIIFGKVVSSGEKVHLPLHLIVRFKFPANHDASARQGLQVINEEIFKEFLGRDVEDIENLKISLFEENDESEADYYSEHSAPLHRSQSQVESSGKYGVPTSILYGSDDEDEPLPRSSSASPIRGTAIDNGAVELQRNDEDDDDDDDYIRHPTPISPTRDIAAESVGLSFANALVPSSLFPHVDPPTPLNDEDELEEEDDDGIDSGPKSSPEPELDHHEFDDDDLDSGPRSSPEPESDHQEFTPKYSNLDRYEAEPSASGDEDAEVDLDQAEDHQFFRPHIDPELRRSEQGDAPETEPNGQGVWYSYSSDSEGGDDEDHEEAYPFITRLSEEKQPKIEQEVEAEKLARRNVAMEFMKSRRSARSSQSSTSPKSHDGSPGPARHSQADTPSQHSSPAPTSRHSSPRFLSPIFMEIDRPQDSQSPSPGQTYPQQEEDILRSDRSDSSEPEEEDLARSDRSESSGPEEELARSDKSDSEDSGSPAPQEREMEMEHSIKQEEEELGPDIGSWSKDGRGEWIENVSIDEEDVAIDHLDVISPLPATPRYAEQVENVPVDERHEYEQGDEYDEIEDYEDEEEQDMEEYEEEEEEDGEGEIDEEYEEYGAEYLEEVEDSDEKEEEIARGYEDEEAALREVEMEGYGEDGVDLMTEDQRQDYNYGVIFGQAALAERLDQRRALLDLQPEDGNLTSPIGDIAENEIINQEDVSIEQVDQDEDIDIKDDDDEDIPSQPISKASEPAYIDGSSQTEEVPIPTSLGSPLALPAQLENPVPIIPVSTLINKHNIPSIPTSAATAADIIESTESELNDIAQVLNETREIVGLPKLKNKRWKNWKGKGKGKGKGNGKGKGKKENKSAMTNNTSLEAIQQSHIPLESSSSSDTSSNGPITPKYKLRPLKRSAGMAGLDDEVDPVVIIQDGNGDGDGVVLPQYPNETVGRASLGKRFKKVGEVMGLIFLGAALGSVGTIAGLMQMAD